MVYPTRTASPTTSSILDGLSLHPLPYPVLLIIAVISLFLGIQWYSSYEEAAESAEESINWLLFATPVVLVFLVKWLSSMENPGFFGMSNDPRRRYYNCGTDGTGGGGSSPWGVAALIVLLLVLVQYQSIFLDSWFI